MADFNAVIEADPTDTASLLHRGQLKAGMGDAMVRALARARP